MRVLTARRSHQTFLALLLKAVRKRLLHLVKTPKLAMLQTLSERLLCRGVACWPSCRNDPRLLRSARSFARLVRQTMKIGLTALTLRPACVLGVLFVKKKENRFRLIVDCRKANALFAPPPPVELLSGDGLLRIEVGSSGLAHGESPGLHDGCADVADCFHRMRLSGEVRHFFCWPGGSDKYLQMRD